MAIEEKLIGTGCNGGITDRFPGIQQWMLQNLMRLAWIEPRGKLSGRHFFYESDLPHIESQLRRAGYWPRPPAQSIKETLQKELA